PHDPGVTAPAATAPAAGFPSAALQLLARCGHTCTDSCNYTCGGQSCGHTTGIFDTLASLVNPATRALETLDPGVTAPAATAPAAGFPSAALQLLARCGHTCTDSCSYTCGGQSCGHTTGVFDTLASRINPALGGMTGIR
ncbi:hypothetical protein, partial [Massilia sp. CCM 8734]|uniref:hypothetical protein n=1 Tax=Massilia sp. CCM 8734 TaxID=2609283 RepID=UPI001AAFEBDA